MRRFAAVLAAVTSLAIASLAVGADTQPAAGSATGTVMLPEGVKPAPGVVVTALLYAADRSHDPTEAGTATTAADGTFTLTGLAPGNYLFKFAQGKTAAASKSGTVVAGKATALGKIVLKPVSNTGQKTEPRTNPPKKGA